MPELMMDTDLWITNGPAIHAFCVRKFAAPDCLLAPILAIGKVEVGDVVVVMGHAVDEYQRFYRVKELTDACDNHGIAEGYVLIQLEPM